MALSLIAGFTKQFPGGPLIRAELHTSAEGRAVTVLFGPSGSGKTTVLRCLAGLEQPDQGAIRFGDETWFDSTRQIHRSPQHRGIGFVFQDYALFPHLSVRDNLGYGLASLPHPEQTRRIADALDRFRLADLAAKHPRQLSGGEQQRVALARALTFRPRLLLLDEPLSALDSALREQLRGELRQSLAACDIPVLLVTHERDEALALGDQLVVISHGRMLQTGPVLEVFNRPADANVAQIVRVETLQPGRVIGVSDGLATVEVGSARIIALAPPTRTPDVFVSIRAEEVILQQAHAAPTSVRNRLPARVVAIHPGSPLVRIELDAGFPLLALVTRPACEELDLHPGSTVAALIKAPAVHLIPR